MRSNLLGSPYDQLLPVLDLFRRAIAITHLHWPRYGSVPTLELLYSG